MKTMTKQDIDGMRCGKKTASGNSILMGHKCHTYASQVPYLAGLNTILTKAMLVTLLFLGGGMVNDAWAATYTYHIVDGSGKDIITATSTSGTLVAPDEINSPWCDLTYWDAATGGTQLNAVPGSDADIYVRYTVKTAYERYFNGTTCFEMNVNGSVIWAQRPNVKAYNSRSNTRDVIDTEYYKYWRMEGDPYSFRLYNARKGEGVNPGPLSLLSDLDSGTSDLEFSTSDGVYSDMMVLYHTTSANPNNFAFRFVNTTKEIYLNSNNPVKAWVTSSRDNGGNKITLTPKAFVTYHLVSRDNTVVFSYMQASNDALTAAPALNSNFISPAATNFHYYTTQAKAYANTESSDITQLADAANSAGHVYVGYDYNPSNSVTIGSKNYTVSFDGSKLYSFCRNTDPTANTYLRFSSATDNPKTDQSYDGEDYSLFRLNSVDNSHPDPYRFTINCEAFSDYHVSSSYGNGNVAYHGGTQNKQYNVDTEIQYFSYLKDGKVIAFAIDADDTDDYNTYACYWNTGEWFQFYGGNNSLMPTIVDAVNLGVYNNAVPIIFEEREKKVNATFNIISIDHDGNGGELLYTFACTGDAGGVIDIPNQYKSPLAKNYKFYTAEQFTISDGLYKLNPSATETTRFSTTDGSVYYVKYEYDDANSVTMGSNTLKIDLSGNTIYKWNLQTEASPQWQVTGSTTATTQFNSKNVTYIGVDQSHTETPTTWTSNFLWTLEGNDPYNFVIRNVANPLYFYSWQNGTGYPTSKTHKRIWNEAQATASGAAFIKHWALLADNKLISEDAGDGYVIFHHNDGWANGVLLANIASTSEADVLFSLPDLVTYHVVNKSNAIAISKTITPASGSITMPDDLKTPYITDNNNYKFFSTQADAYAYSSAANDAARTTAATKAISGTVHAGQVIYVGYYYDENARPSDLPILDGSVWYQMINNGTKYWKGVWNSNLGNTSPDKDTSGGSQDEYLWKYTGNDPYAIYVSNKWLNNEHNGGNDAELLRSGWNNGGFYHANYASGTPHGGTPHMILTAGVNDGSGNAYYNLAVSHPNGPMETTNYYVLSENCRGYQTDTPHPRYHNPNSKALLQFHAVAMGNFRFHLFTHISGTELVSDITADYSTTTNLVTLPSDLIRKFASSEGKYYTSYSEGAFSNAYTNYHDMWLNGTHQNEGEENEYVDIYVDYTTSQPFTVSTDYEHATWYRTYNNNNHYARYDGSQVTSGSDSYTVDYQFAFIGDPYEMKIISRQAGSGKYLGVAAGSSSGTVANFIVDSGDPIITWELVDNGFAADEFALRQYGTASSPMYCAYSGGTTPLRLISTTTRIKAVALPEFTYTFNIVDNTGRIAIKYTLKSSEKLKPTTPLASNYTAIPEAIRSPYIEGETLTFYSTATQRVDGESNPVTDADGRAVYDLSSAITQTPVTDNANIYVRYTNTTLATKPLHLRGVRGFDIKVNGGHYLYDNGSGTLTHDASTTNLNDRHHLWYFKGLDPYAVEVQNIGGEQYLLHSESPSAALTYGTDAAGRYFILMQYADFDDAPTNEVIRVELMAATGGDLGGATPASYYSVGATGGTPNLYANATGYEHGDATLKLLLTVGHVSVVYDIVDKQGKIVVAGIANESAVTPSLPEAWQSPLVKKYHYWNSSNFDISGTTYTLKTSQTEIEGIAEAADGHVYVTYDVKTSSDDGYVDLNIGTDYTYRQARSGTDATQVRRSTDWGTMYRLQFTSNAPYHLENGSDREDTNETASGTHLYPYTNGDGPLYIYPESRWNTQKDAAASTRTRWTWFLLSQTGDPYRVMITSWQNSHAYSGTNYYSFLRTYYNSELGAVVTNNITDDPRTVNSSGQQIMPTEYMILNGTSSTGNYLLKTSELVNGDHQTVNSFEQYWRNNPTVQRKLGMADASGEPTDAQKATLRPTWHNYNAYVNATPWAGGSKSYSEDEHWFMTVNMGDGSFNLVPTEMDAALVLIDQHGWEIMRRPVYKSASQADLYAASKVELKKFNSPMVAKYHYYINASKQPGYHKYTVAASNLQGTTPSLGDDYPQSYQGGMIRDLYVTYDVKPEYADGYDAETATATAYLVKQGTQYAKDAGSLTIAKETISDITTVTDNALLWYVLRNINIDEEMAYVYSDAVNGTKSKAETEADYLTEGKNGFDPYNLQIKNKSTGNYFKSNLSGSTLSSGSWTGTYSGSKTLTLGATLDAVAGEGHDNTTLAMTNATFMAIDDGNGNIRLMPRFDHSVVQTDLATLETRESAAAPVEDDGSGSTQTTLFQLAQAYTYIIMDNEGREALRYTSVGDAGPRVPLKFASPLATDFTFYRAKSGTGSTTEYSNQLTTFSGISMGSDPIYVRYKYDPTTDADGLLKGTWYNTKLNSNDVKVTTGGIAQETFTNDAAHRWRFMQSAASDADPYAVTLWNGNSETESNRYIVMKPTDIAYALMQAGNSSTTEYKFLDGSSTPAITSQADYATLGTIATTKYLTLTSVLASNSVIFKIITNTGKVALTSEEIAVTAATQLSDVMPAWMKTPLLKNSAYVFYPAAIGNDDDGYTVKGISAKTASTLDNNVVYVRYNYNESTRQAVDKFRYSNMETANAPMSCELDLSGTVPYIPTIICWNWSYVRDDATITQQQDKDLRYHTENLLWYLTGNDPYEIQFVNAIYDNGKNGTKVLSAKTPSESGDAYMQILTMTDKDDSDSDYKHKTFMFLSGTSSAKTGYVLYATGEPTLIVREHGYTTANGTYYNYYTPFLYKDDKTYKERWYNNQEVNGTSNYFCFRPAITYHVITNKGVEAMSCVSSFNNKTVSIPERIQSPLMNITDYTYYSERPVWDGTKLTVNENSKVSANTALTATAAKGIADIYVRYEYDRTTSPIYIHNDNKLPMPDDVTDDTWYLNTYAKTRDTGSSDYAMVKGLDLSGQTWYNMTDFMTPYGHRGTFTYYNGSSFTTTGASSGIMNTQRPTLSAKGMLWRFEGDDPYAIRIYNGATGSNTYVQGKEFALVKFYTNDYGKSGELFSYLPGAWWFVFMETGNDTHLLRNDMTILNAASSSYWDIYNKGFYYSINNNTFCPGFYKAPVARKYRYHAYNQTTGQWTWEATLEHDWLMPLVLEDEIARLYCKYEKNTVGTTDNVTGSNEFDTRAALEALDNAQFYSNASMTQRVFDEDETTHEKTYDIYPAIDTDDIYDIYFKYQVDNEATVKLADKDLTLSDLTSTTAQIATDVTNRKNDGILKEDNIQAKWFYMVLDTDENISATGTGTGRTFTGKQQFLRREDNGTVGWMNNDYALHKNSVDNYNGWSYNRLAESYRQGENEAFREGRWLWAFVGDDPYNLRVLNMESAVGVAAEGSGIYTLTGKENCWTTISEQTDETKDGAGNVTATTTTYPISIPTAEPTANNTWGIVQSNDFDNGEQTFNLLSTAITKEQDGTTINLPLFWQMVTNSETKVDSVAGITRAKDRSNAIQLLPYTPTKYEDVKLVIRRKDEVNSYLSLKNGMTADERLEYIENKMTTGTNKLYFAAHDRKYVEGDVIDLDDRDHSLPVTVRRAFCDYTLYKSEEPFDVSGSSYTVKAGPYPTTEETGEYDDDGRMIYKYTSDGTLSGTPAASAQAVYASYVVTSDIFLKEHPTEAQVQEMADTNDHVYFMDFPTNGLTHHAYFDPMSTMYERTGNLKSKVDSETGTVRSEKKIWNGTEFVDDKDDATGWYNHYEYRTADNRMESVPEYLKWYFVGDPYKVQVYCTAGAWGNNNGNISNVWTAANGITENKVVAANLCRFDESETNFQFVLDCVHLRIPDYSNIDERATISPTDRRGNTLKDADGNPITYHNRHQNEPYYNDFTWECVPAASDDPNAFALRFKEDNDLLQYRNVYYYLAHDGLKRTYTDGGTYPINLSYNPDNATHEKGDYKGYHTANDANTVIKLVQPAKVYVTVNRTADSRYGAKTEVVKDELSEYYGLGETITEVPRHLQRKFVSYDWTDKTLTASNATSDCNQPSGSTPIHQQTINDLMDSPVAKEKINPVFKFDVNYTVDDDTYDKEENKVVHYFTTKENFENGNLEWIDMAVAGTNWLYFDKNQSDLKQVSNYRTAVGDNTASGWNDGLKGLHWALVGDPYDFTIVNRRRYEDGSHSDAQWLAVTKTTIADWKGTVPNDSVIWTTSLKDYDTAVPSDAHSAATTPTAITDDAVNTHFALQMWKTGGDRDYFLRTSSLKTSDDDPSNNKAGNQTNNYWRMVAKQFEVDGSTDPKKYSYFEMVPFSLGAKGEYGNTAYTSTYSKTMAGLGVTQQKLDIRTAVAKDEDAADNNCFDADIEIVASDGTVRLFKEKMEIRYGDAIKSLPYSLQRYGCTYTCYVNYVSPSVKGTELTKFVEIDDDSEEYEALHNAMADAVEAHDADATKSPRVKLTYVYEVKDATQQYFTTQDDASTDDYTWMNTYFQWMQPYSGSSVEVERRRTKFDHYVYDSNGLIIDEVWIEETYTDVITNPETPIETKGYLNTHTSQEPVYADNAVQSESERQKWSLVGDPYGFTMKNYAQYLKNDDATVVTSGDAVTTQNYGDGQLFAYAIDEDGTPYLAIIDNLGNVTKLVDFEFSATSDKSLETVGDGVNQKDPTGNSLATTYTKNGKTATVKPFYLASLIKYADILVYHLVMAHQHSLDAEDKNSWTDGTSGTVDQKTGYDANGSPTGVYSRLLEFLKYWGVRNNTSYLSNSDVTAAQISSDYETAIGSGNVSNVKTLLKQKGTLRNFLSYPVPDQEVSRVGIGNRPQLPWYMKRQFCTYYMYQKDVMRSAINYNDPLVVTKGGVQCYVWVNESAGVTDTIPTSQTKNSDWYKACNITWVSVRDVSYWKDAKSTTSPDSIYVVTANDVTTWSGTGHDIAEGNKKIIPSYYNEVVALQGKILDKLEDCHYNRKVLIDVVYEVNPERFHFADRGRNTTAWYSMMTNNDVDGLMNFSYREGIGARQDKTHHYTNNYLWSPEGDPYGFVLRSRYATINGTGWDDVAVTTRGKLPKGKNESGLVYIDGSGDSTTYAESTELGTVDKVQATYTSRATSSGGIPFSNKRIIHRRTGQDGATTDGATNAVYEMFVGSNKESFLMHPTAAWMDNSDSEHESYFLKHITSTTSTGTINGNAYEGHHAYLIKGNTKNLLNDADANWRLKATSEQLIPYFKRSGYVGGLQPLKAMDFTNQNYLSQLQQSIANNTDLDFTTVRKIQDLVYSGTFTDNTGATVAETADRPIVSLLPMTFTSTNLVSMKPGYYRIQAFSEDALNTDGQDLAGDGSNIQGIIGPRYISGYRFESEKTDPKDDKNNGGRWLHFLETDMEHSAIHTYADLLAIISNVDTQKGGTSDRDQISHPAMAGNIEIPPTDFDPSSIFQFAQTTSAGGHLVYNIGTQGLKLWARPGTSEVDATTGTHEFGRTELVESESTPSAEEGYGTEGINWDDKFRLADIGGAAMTLHTLKQETSDWDTDVAENLKTNYICIDRNHRYRITCHTDNEMKEIGDHYTTDGYNGIQDTKWLLQPVGIHEDEYYHEMPLRVEVHQGGVKNQEDLSAADNDDPYYYGSLYVPFDARLSRTTDAAFTLTTTPTSDASRIQMQSVSQMNGMGNPQYVPSEWPVVIRTDKPTAVTLVNQDDTPYATRYYVNMYLPNDEPQPALAARSDIKLEGKYLEQSITTDERVMVFGLPFKDHAETHNDADVSHHEYNTLKHVGWYSNDNWARAEENGSDIFSEYKPHEDSYASTATVATVATDAQRSNKYVYHNKVYLLTSLAGEVTPTRHIVALFDDEDWPEEEDDKPISDDVTRSNVPWPCDVYDLQGRKVAENETPQTLLVNHPGLTKGVYIFGGRKVVVK